MYQSRKTELAAWMASADQRLRGFCTKLDAGLVPDSASHLDAGDDAGWVREVWNGEWLKPFPT